MQSAYIPMHSPENGFCRFLPVEVTDGTANRACVSLIKCYRRSFTASADSKFNFNLGRPCKKNKRPKRTRVGSPGGKFLLFRPLILATTASDSLVHCPASHRYLCLTWNFIQCLCGTPVANPSGSNQSDISRWFGSSK